MTVLKMSLFDQISRLVDTNVTRNKGLQEVAKRLPPLGPANAETRTPRQAVIDILRARLIVPTQYGSRDQAEIDDIEATVSSLLNSQNWRGLSDLIRKLDQSRIATPSGIRHLEIATYYIRGHLSEFYEEPTADHCEYAFGHSDETIETIRNAAEAFPDNYALAALLARLHLDCGWAARADEDPSIMAEHYHRARKLITKFDPVLHNSPFLAEIQYRLCIGLPDGHDRLGAAFSDWSDLDPGNITALKQHAFLCLPEWFGDSEVLSFEAQAIVRQTRNLMGAAAYTIMMIQALKFDKKATIHLDADLFLEGLKDHFEFYNSDPFRVTATLRDMSEAFQLDEQDQSPAAFAFRGAVEKIYATIAPILRDNLTVFSAPAWPGGADQFLEWVACAYADELVGGKKVAVKPTGCDITDFTEEPVG